MQYNDNKIPISDIDIVGVYKKNNEPIVNLKSPNYQKEFGKYTAGRIFENNISNLSDERARSQTTSDKFFNAFAKTLITAGTTVADIYVTPTVGLASAIEKKSLTGFFDNEISVLLNKIRNNSEIIFPNYRTQEELNSPFYENMFKNPANFWFDEFMKNTGFTIGMLAGGAGMGSLLRNITGVSKYRALGKFSEDLAKTALSNAEKTKLLLKNYPGLNTPEKLSALAKSIKTRNAMVNVATMALSSTAEANVEALNYMDEMKAMYPDLDEASISKGALLVWAANLGILMPSGYIQFKKVLTRNFTEALPLNKVIIGNTIKDISELTSKELKRGGIRQAEKGLTRNAFLSVAKNMAAEGLFEEMGQNVVQITAEKMATLYKDNYSLKNILSALGKGIEGTYTTEEGWHEGVLGMLTALLPFGGKGSGITQVFTEPRQIRANTQTVVDFLNDTEGFKGKFTELYNNANFQHNLEDIAGDSEENQYTQYVRNELGLANDVGTFSALGRVDILKDRYRAVLDLDDIGEVLNFLGIDEENVRSLDEIHEIVNGIIDKISEYEGISDSTNTVFNGLKDKDIDYKHTIRNILFHRKISEKYATKKHSEIVNNINDFNISNINLTSSIIADITKLYNAQSVEEIQEVLNDIRDNEDYKDFNNNELYFNLGVNLSLLTEAVIDRIYYSNVYNSILTKEGRDEFKSSFVKSNLEYTLELEKQKIENLKAKRDEIKENFEKDGRDALNEIIESLENMKEAHTDKEYRAKVDEVIKDLKDFRDNIENELKQEAKEEKQKQEAKKVEDFIDNFQIKDNITKKDLEDFDYNTDSDFISDKHKIKKEAFKKIMSRKYLSKYINDTFLNNIESSKDKNEIKSFQEESVTISNLLENDTDFANENKDLVGKYYTILENLKDDPKEDEEGKDMLFTDEEKDTLSMMFNIQIKINNENERIASLTKNPEARVKKMGMLITNMKTRDYMKNATAKFLNAIDYDEITLYENDSSNPTQFYDYINIIREKFDKAFPEARKRNTPPVLEKKITQEMLDEIEAAHPVNFHTANTYNYNAKNIREKINDNKEINKTEGEIHNRLMNLKKGDVLKIKVNGSLILEQISKDKTVFETLIDELMSKTRLDIESVKDFIGNIPFVFVDNNGNEVGMSLQSKKYQDDILKKGENNYFENKYNEVKQKHDNASEEEKEKLKDKLNKALGDFEVYNKIKNEYNLTMQIRYKLFLKAINENLLDIFTNKNNPNKLEEIFSKNTIELEIENTTDVQPFLDEKENYVSDMVESKYKIDVGFLEVKDDKSIKESIKPGNFNFLSYQSHKIEERIEKGSKNIFYEKPIDERLRNHYRAGTMVIKLQNGMPMIVFGNFNNLYNKNKKYIDVFEKNIMSNVINLLNFKTTSSKHYDKIYDKEARSAKYNELTKKKIDKIKNFFYVSDFVDILKRDDKKQRNEVEAEIDTYISKKSLIKLSEKSSATINYKGIVNREKKIRYNIFAIKSPSVEIQKGNEKIYKGQIDVYVQGYKLVGNTNEKVFMQKITLNVNNDYNVIQYDLNKKNDEFQFFEEIENNLKNTNITIQKDRLNELFEENKEEYTAVADTIFHSLKAPYKVVKDNKGNVISNLNPEGKRPFTVSVKFKDEARSVQGEDSESSQENQSQENSDVIQNNYLLNEINKNIKNHEKIINILELINFSNIDNRIDFTTKLIDYFRKNNNSDKNTKLLISKLNNYLNSLNIILDDITNELKSHSDINKIENFLNKNKYKNKIEYFEILKTIYSSSFYNNDKNVLQVLGNFITNNEYKYTLNFADYFDKNFEYRLKTSNESWRKYLISDIDNDIIFKLLSETDDIEKILKEEYTGSNVKDYSNNIDILSSTSFFLLDVIEKVKNKKIENFYNFISEHIGKLNNLRDNFESVPSTEEQSAEQIEEQAEEQAAEQIEEQAEEQAEEFNESKELENDNFNDDIDRDSNMSDDPDYFFKDDVLDKSMHIPLTINRENQNLDRRAYIEFDKKINNIYKKNTGREIQLITEERAKKMISDLSDDVRGFWKNGNLYIIKERKNPDVLLHESLHPFIDILEKQNPEVYKNILNEAKNNYSEILNKINEKYDKKSVDKELLVYAIQSEIMTLNESSNILKDFLNWLREFITKGITNIALFFGSTNYKYLNKNTTIKDIAKLKYYTELLSEEYLKEQFLDSSERRLTDKEKALIKPQLASLYAKEAYKSPNTRLKTANRLSDIRFIHKLLQHGSNEINIDSLIGKSLIELMANKDFLKEIQNEYNKLFKFKESDKVNIDDLVEDSTRGLDLNDTNKTGIHQRNSANLQIKLFLASLTQSKLNNKDKKITTIIKNGLPLGIDYNNFFHKLMILGTEMNINSFDSFFNELEAKRLKVLEINSMLNQLDEIKKECEKINDMTHYDDLRNAIYTTFNKTSNKITLLSVDSSVATRRINNEKSIKYAIANELLSKSVRYLKGIEIGLHDKKNMLNVISAEMSIDKFDALRENLSVFLYKHRKTDQFDKLDEENISKLNNILNDIIELLDLSDIVTAENFEVILNNNNNKIEKDDIFHSFFNYIDDVYGEVTYTHDKKISGEGVQNVLNKRALEFSGALYIYGNKLPDAMTQSAEKKQLYTFGDKSYVDKVINQIHGKDANSRESFLNAILNDKTLENSYLKNEIFNKDNTVKRNFAEHLDIKLFSGIRHRTSGRNYDFKNMNGYDKIFVDLMFFEPKKYNSMLNTVLIPFSPFFDSGTNNYIELPEIKINYNEIAEWSKTEEKIVKSAIFNPEIIYQPERTVKTEDNKSKIIPEKTSEYFEAVYRSVKVEMERMKLAKSLVDRYNKGEKVVLYNNEHGYFDYNNNFVTHEKGKYIGNAFKFHFLTGLNELIDGKTGIVDESLITKEAVAKELQKLLLANYDYIQSQDYDLYKYVEGHEIIYIMKALINRIVYGQGLTEMFSGHISNYKNLNDYYQRNKFIGTIGINGALDEEVKYITFHDPLYSTALENEYRNQLEKSYKANGFTDENIIKEKINEAIDDYKNMVATDGQIYCTPEFYEKYQKNIGKELSSKGRGAHSLKPLVFLRESKNDTSYAKGIKSSMFAINETMGDKYKILLDFMRNNKIDMVVASSSVKMGLNTQTISLFENGTLNFTDAIGKFQSDKIQSFNMRDLMVQQELPESHINHSNKTSSQVLPLMVSNIQDDFVYTGANGKQYNGSEIKKIHDKIFSGILNYEKNKIFQELNIKTDENGNIVKYNRNRLFELLENELKENPRSIVNVLKSNSNLSKLPLYGERLKSVIDSYISKRMIYPKLPGSHNIAVSDALDDSLKARYDVISKKTKEVVKKDVNKDEEFDPNTEEMALIIPIKMPRWDSALEDVSIEKIPIDSRRMIGYRIPYSGKSLSFIAEVVGFTPRSSGSTIIIGKDVIARTGFDFDIDTFYFIQRKLKRMVGKKTVETRINKETNKEFKISKRPITIESENSFFNPENKKDVDKMEIEELYNSFIDLYEMILGSSNHAIESITPANYKKSVEISKNINDSLIRTDKYPTHVSIETSTEYIKNVLYQKKLIAIVANTNTMLSKLASYGAYFAKSKWHWMDENETTHQLDKFNTIKSIDGSEMSAVNISTNLNHAVDAVKKLLPVTFNENTASYVLTMMKLGVPYEAAMYIIGQQSVYEYNQFLQRSKISKKNFGIKNIIGTYNNNAKNLLTAFSSKYESLNEFAKDIVKKYGKIEGATDYKGNRDAIIGMYEDDIDSKGSGINETPSRIKYFSQNNKIFNEANIKITNAIKKQEEFKKLIPAKHQPSISSISDITSKIRELIFDKNFNENTTYKVLFDYKDRKLIVSGVEEIKDVTKAKADDIIIKKRKDNYDKTRSYKVFTFYDLRKTEAKTSLDEFLKSKEGKLKENTTEEEFIKDLVAYNKFQVHVLENVINFNKTIGAELKNVIPIFGMEKKKVNESNPQRVKEAFFKSERKGNLLFANKKGIYSNMIGENHTNEISKIKYSSQNVSNALNKFNTIDPQNNISVIAYKLLSDFGYEISSNPRYEKRIKESVFMQHFKNNISSESIFNISNDEKIRLLGFDDYQDIKLTTEYEKEAWATLPLSVQIQSIKKTLNAKKSLKDINKKIIIDDNGQIIEETLNNKVEALTDENFKLYNKTTSLLLNLKVENDSISKNLKDGLTLITLDLDVKDLDVINLLTDSFEEMLNSDIDIIRDVAVDLVKYLYLTTGFSFSTNQLCSVLDFTKLEQYGISDINNVLNKAGDVENITIGDEILLDSLVAFVLNNPNLFKFISSKQKEIEQKSKELREKNEIKLIDNLEENYEKTKDDIDIIKEKKINLILEHFNSKNIRNFDNVQEKDDIENIKNIEDLDDIELIEDYLRSKLSKGNYDNTGFYSVPLGENTEYNKYLFYIYYKNKLTRVAGKGNSYLYETNINEKSIISDNNGNMTESDIIKGNNEIREYLKEILTKGLTSVIVHSESFDKIFSGGLTNVFRSRFKQIYEGARFGFNDKVDILKNLIDLHLKDYLTFANNIESVSFNESDRLLTFNFKNDRKLILNLTNEEIDSIIIYNANKNRKPSKPIVENENNENEIEENKNEDTIIDELINNEYQDEIRKLKFEDIESRVDILYEIIKRKYNIKEKLTEDERKEKEFQKNALEWSEEEKEKYNNVIKEKKKFDKKTNKFDGIFTIEKFKDERSQITKEKDEYKKKEKDKNTEEYKNKIKVFDEKIEELRSKEEEINTKRREYVAMKKEVVALYNSLSYTLTVAFNSKKEVSKKEKEKDILKEKINKAKEELNTLEVKYNENKLNDINFYIDKIETQIKEKNDKIKEVKDSFEKIDKIKNEIETKKESFFEFANNDNLINKLLKEAELTKAEEQKKIEEQKKVEEQNKETSYLDNENTYNIDFKKSNNKSSKMESILKTSDKINAIEYLNSISIGIQEKNGTVYFGVSRELNDEKFEIISTRIFNRFLVTEPILNTTLNILEDFIVNNENDIVIVDNEAKENILKVFKAYNNFLETNKNNITNTKAKAVDVNKISEKINLKSNFVASSKIVNEAQANALKSHNEKKC